MLYASALVVYFIQQGQSGAVNIGHLGGKNWGRLHKRLDTLQTGSGAPLFVRAVMDGSAAVGARLHRRFADVRLTGEWFELTEEIEALMAEHAVDSQRFAEARNSNSSTKVQLNARVDLEVREAVAVAALASGRSVNGYVERALRDALAASKATPRRAGESPRSGDVPSRQPGPGIAPGVGFAYRCPKATCTFTADDAGKCPRHPNLTLVPARVATTGSPR